MACVFVAHLELARDAHAGVGKNFRTLKSCSMSTKSGLKTCLKKLLQCFALDVFCSEAKHCRSVLRHVLRPNFVDILQLLELFYSTRNFYFLTF